MDTSKDYYEAVMRDFKLYARGRSLEQYCRDEAVDYQWLTKAKAIYGEPEATPKKKSSSKPKSKQPDMIKLHFEEDEPQDSSVGTPNENLISRTPEPSVDTENEQWSVASLKITTPSGDEIEIRSTKTSAVSQLLAKLAL